MRNTKRNIHMLASIGMLMAADPSGFSPMSDDLFSPDKPRVPDLPNPLGQHNPPKGTSEYFFNINGEFANHKTPPMRRDESVFWCYAINDKNAIRKFKLWKQKQT